MKRHKLHYEKLGDKRVRCIENSIPFAVPDGWQWCRLGMIAQIDRGKTLDTAKNTGTYYRYLRSANILWNAVDISHLKEMKFDENELERYRVCENDLLVCEGGTPGRCCVWDRKETIYYQNALHRIRFFGGINPYFFMYVLMCYEQQGKIKDICKGVTIRHLTKTSLSSLLFPVPPQKEYDRILNVLNLIFSHLDKIDFEKNRLLNMADSVKSKIQHLTITGNLTEQNFSDEPASQLLKKIKNQEKNPSKQRKAEIFRSDDNSYYANSLYFTEKVKIIYIHFFTQ